MCGLVGIFKGHAVAAIDQHVLQRMNDALVHRGPDEQGIYHDRMIGLGHRRLSIIDLQEGQQPMFNHDRSVVVVFNGEIYNFQALRAQLEGLGHHFVTHSDTEVIVHAWESWGVRCVEHFRGMFAFAVWDSRRGSLFLARDRFGIKPLYYGLTRDGQLIFASEIKSLRQHPQFDSNLDSLAIEDYFGFGYVPEPRSIFRNTLKLPPAHTLLIKAADKSLPDPVSYWDIPLNQIRYQSDHAAIAGLRQQLRESVQIHLISERPLGAFLSGGVDSSSVVANMAGLREGQVNTCSIAFDECEFDESSYAQAVATRYRTCHRVERVDLNDYSLLDKLAAVYDEPFADSSALPTYRVCQLAKQHVSVVLSGDGGDEVLAGYERYAQHLLDLTLKNRLPQWGRSFAGALGRYYPAQWVPSKLNKRQALLALAQDPVTAFFELNSLMKNDLRRQLYHPAFTRQLHGYRADQVSHRHAAQYPAEDPLALAQYLDLKTYLPGDILTKVDRASMAHALEVRVPLLDHRLVEWATALPTAQKRRHGQGKWLLKQAMQTALPADLLYRSKRGFAVPLRQWFAGPLRTHVEGVLSSTLLHDAKIFSVPRLQQMWQHHLAGKQDFSPQIWSILMFESFLRTQLS